MEPVTFTFFGMDTIKDKTRLQSIVTPNSEGGELVLAKDVDITRTGVVTARKGYRKVLSLSNCHSLWSHPLAGTYFVSDYGLYSLSETYVATKIATLESDERTDFEFVNDVIVFTNNKQIGFIKGTEVFFSENNHAQIKLSLDDTQEQIDSRLDTIPAGHFVTMTAYGSMLIACGNEVIESEPYNIEVTHRISSYTPLDSEITMLRAVDDGVWVSTKTCVWFRSGAYDEVQWIKKANYPAIHGVNVVSEASILNADVMPSEKVVWFATTHGICIGGNGGRLLNISEGIVSIGQGTKGSAFIRRQDGQTDFIASIDNVLNQYNPHTQSAEYD